MRKLTTTRDQEIQSHNPQRKTVVADKGFCRTCGKELVGAGIFCQSCGARQDTANPGSVYGSQQVPQQQVFQSNAAFAYTNYSRIKFPIAAIFYILLVLVSVALPFVQMRGIPLVQMMMQLHPTFMLVLADIFLIVVLLQKRHGNSLVASVSIVGFLSLHGTFQQAFAIVSGNSGVDSAFLVMSLLQALAGTSIVWFVITCNRSRTTTAKLWFIPGLLSLLALMVNYLPNISILLRIVGNVLMFFNILSTFLGVIALFLLGHWISYITSAKSV